MQNYDEIQRILIILIISNKLVFIVVASNFTYAQENRHVHEKTLYEITKYTPKENADISVGQSPWAIDVNSFTDTIYVANTGDDTVSIIDRIGNTKIKDIPVGKKPTAIGVDSNTKTIYVANFGDNTVSVIDGTSNTKTKDISVGMR